MNRNHRPMPTDREALRAIPLADRLQFDSDQRMLWVARWTDPGDWLYSLDYGSEGRECVYGRVDRLVTDLRGRPAFVIGDRVMDYLDLATPDGWCLLLPGDVVEVQLELGGEWNEARVHELVEPRQNPRIRVEGSRKLFHPGADLRIPAAAGVELQAVPA